MGRMIFELTDEDRLALEALRKSGGYRSHAETLRMLIRLTPPIDWKGIAQASARFGESAAATVEKAFLNRQTGERFSGVGPEKPTVPTMQRKAFNPQPKKGK